MKTEFKTSISELVSEVELKLSNIMIVTHQKTINDAFDNSFREYAASYPGALNIIHEVFRQATGDARRGCWEGCVSHQPLRPSLATTILHVNSP